MSLEEMALQIPLNSKLDKKMGNCLDQIFMSFVCVVPYTHFDFSARDYAVRWSKHLSL